MRFGKDLLLCCTRNEKLQEKLANYHIGNEDGQKQILSGESGIVYDFFKCGHSIKFKNELVRMSKKNIALAEKHSLSERTLAMLQEEYESVLEKIDMKLHEILESRDQ